MYHVELKYYPEYRKWVIVAYRNNMEDKVLYLESTNDEIIDKVATDTVRTFMADTRFHAKDVPTDGQ